MHSLCRRQGRWVGRLALLAEEAVLALCHINLAQQLGVQVITTDPALQPQADDVRQVTYRFLCMYMCPMYIHNLLVDCVCIVI